jgi:hypothetical protein
LLTEAQKLAREGKLTASRVACLMTGDKAKIIQVWRELCGDPTVVEENLDDVWEVQLGSTTEQLNLDWYQRTHDRILTRRGEVVQHPDYSWAAATLDGFDLVLPGPVETKHVNGFEKFENVVQRYMPQTHWQMECTNTKHCALSVIQGARRPTIEIIDYDKAYADELMARALRFMEHVWNYTEPVMMDPVEVKRITRTKDYVMTGSNAWSSAAAQWLQHNSAAKLFDDAETALKSLVPDDAATCTGYGVVVTRDKANRIRVRDINEKRAASKRKIYE